MVLLSLVFMAAAAELPLLGRTNAVDTIRGLKVVGGTAFAAAETSGLVAVDVRKPEEARELWRVWTGGDARGVEVVEDTAYVADSRSGLQVVQNGSVVGGFSEPCLEVHLSGDVAYVRSTRGDVVAFNVTDPASDPEFLGTYNESIAEAFFVVGTTVYTVASAGSGRDRYLNIIDFSTPSSPVLLGSVAANRTLANSLFVSDTTAFITGFWNGLLIFDVTDPSSPSFTAAYDDTYATDVDVVNGTAYIVNFNRFEVVDVDSDTPFFLGNLAVKEGTRVQVTGTIAYIAGHRGIQMLNVETPSSPILLGEFTPSGGDGRAVAVSEDYAYLVGDNTLLQVVDVRDPSSPTVVGVNNDFEDGRAVQVAGNTVYVGGCGFFYAFDVSNPQQPRLLGTYEIRSRRGTVHCALSVHVIGTVAYVGSDLNGFLVLDVSEPSAITLIGSYGLSRIEGVFVSGTMAYIASTSRGLVLLDVGTPSSPTLIGRLGTFRAATAVAVRGATAYVVDREGLHVIDVGTPSMPAVIGFFEVTPSASDVKMFGDTAVVSFDAGVQLVDVSNPSAMRRIDGYASPSRVRGVAVLGNLAYIAETGMSVIELWKETLVPLVPPTAEPAVEPTLAPTTPAKSTTKNKKELVIILILVGAALVLAAVLGMLWWRKQQQQQQQHDRIEERNNNVDMATRDNTFSPDLRV